jgi:hypothetical protein
MYSKFIFWEIKNDYFDYKWVKKFSDSEKR